MYYKVKNLRSKILSCAIFTLIIAILSWHSFYRNYEVTIIGTMNYQDSLGKHGIDILKILGDELDINFKFVRNPNFADLPVKFWPKALNSNDKLGNIILYDYAFHVSYDEFVSFYKSATSGIYDFSKISKDDQLWLAYVMTESNKAHQVDVRIINDFFDAIIVPDESVKNAYQNGGVKKPIFILANLIDLEPFLSKPIKNKRNSPFVFMSLSSLEERKNIPKLIDAFGIAFANDPNVILRINSRTPADHYLYHGIGDAMKKHGLENVELSMRSLSVDEYVKTMSLADVYVSLSMGEGFSIQPREAMALGIPVIVSAATAQRTIANSGLATVVNANKLVPAFFHYYNSRISGQFEDCDVDEAARAMRDIYENYDQKLTIAEAARDWSKQYDLRQLKPKYKQLLTMQNVQLGSNNQLTTNFVETASQELYDKIKNLHHR